MQKWTCTIQLADTIYGVRWFLGELKLEGIKERYKWEAYKILGKEYKFKLIKSIWWVKVTKLIKFSKKLDFRSRMVHLTNFETEEKLLDAIEKSTMRRRIHSS